MRAYIVTTASCMHTQIVVHIKVSLAGLCVFGCLSNRHRATQRKKRILNQARIKEGKLPSRKCNNGRCLVCLMREKYCICDHTPTVSTDLDVLIFRHCKENNKPSNTARLVALSVPRCTIVEYGGRGGLDLSHLMKAKRPVLLFPSDSAQPLPYVPQTLVVVDGSWRQARKLVNKLPRLPRIHVRPINATTARLRRAPTPDAMSTIEAVARAVDQISGGTDGTLLDEFYQRAVQACAKARGRPFN